MKKNPGKDGPHPAWAMVEDAVATAREVLLKARGDVTADPTLSDVSRSMLLGRLWASLANYDRAEAVFVPDEVDKIFSDGNIDFAKPWEYSGEVTFYVRVPGE